MLFVQNAQSIFRLIIKNNESAVISNDCIGCRAHFKKTPFAQLDRKPDLFKRVVYTFYPSQMTIVLSNWQLQSNIRVIIFFLPLDRE